MPRTRTYLTLSEATSMVDAALRAAAAAPGELIAAAVVDPGGALVALGRLDGAAPITAQIAGDKARTAMMFEVPTQVLMDDVSTRPQIGVSLMAVPGLSILVGALPVIVDGECIGGIGISGGRRDPEWAQAGVDAVFGASHD